MERHKISNQNILVTK